MKTIYSTIFVAIVVVIALFTSSCGSRSRQPVYNGRTLSEWASDINPGNPEATRDQAKQAIRQIGTNAIPFLLEELRAFSEINRANFNPFEWQDRRNNIYNAFAALGPIAEPAIPSLTDLMDSGSFAAYIAADALAEIGPKGDIPLVKTLTNGSLAIRVGIAQTISETGTNADIAVPALIQCSTFESSEQELSAVLRGCSATALGIVGVNSPETVVPALIRCLEDKDYRTRFIAVRALGKFGKQAQSAVPALQQIAKNDQNKEFRSAATNILQIIQSNSP